MRKESELTYSEVSDVNTKSEKKNFITMFLVIISLRLRTATSERVLSLSSLTSNSPHGSFRQKLGDTPRC